MSAITFTYNASAKSHAKVQYGTIREFMSDRAPNWHSNWTWENYQPVIEALVRTFNLTELCEIGGGRDPLLNAEAVKRLGVRLTINDISQEELDRAPVGLPTACFDIAGDLEKTNVAPESFDLMFSKMVFEHVPNVEAAWRNMYKLLKPGGVAFVFFPTLYALPFLINYLLPERLSRRLLFKLRSERGDDGGDPKFPAYYNWCFGSEKKLAPMLRRAGFNDFAVQPFWGYGYLDRIPVLRTLDHGFNHAAAKLGIKALTSYAWVLARK